MLLKVQTAGYITFSTQTSLNHNGSHPVNRWTYKMNDKMFITKKRKKATYKIFNANFTTQKRNSKALWFISLLFFLCCLMPMMLQSSRSNVYTQRMVKK